ncbi:hypothetical protein FJW06_18720 [Mesorhizobium sp. B4-1-3]|uniref:hypothetical protein n=1 Tax=Mesorhizobium sp. B4-1-3 TaxID=2589889 RepID=UPI00112ADEF2|nr:hypothetical protein [Mesorhizobium sp. B4-1-3]TPI12051.1 hypothetical protein FJW06_18720 [Mesorhizobium sp. B4-1-3]
MEALVRAEGVNLVIPTCEEVFHLALAWRGRTMPARLFAPDIELLTQVHNKHSFIRLAERLGLAVPETMLLNSRDDLEAVRARSRDLVFKPVWSRFASHVLLRPTGFPRCDHPLARHALGGAALCRGRGDQRLCGGARRQAQGALALPLALSRRQERRHLLRACRGQCGARWSSASSGTTWTGQISFDLMCEPGGRVLPLECNPRAVSGLHFFRDPARFVDAVLGDGPEAD